MEDSMLKKILFPIILLTLVKVSYSQIASLEATLVLKKVDNITIPFQNGIPLPTFEKQNRYIINLSGNWKKQRFNANDNITLSKRDATGYQNLINEASGRHMPNFDDSQWLDKLIPSVENQIKPFPQVPEYYQDGVWYRKSFFVDSSLSGQFVKLIFYAVNYVADVWLNGNYVGYHEGGYTSFAFDVSNYIQYGQTNFLVVRIDNPQWGTRNDIVPYKECDWFNYTGIIHDVYLEFSNPLNIIRADVVPLNTDGDIKTTVVLYNKSNVNKQVDVTLEVFNAEINSQNITSERASELIGTIAQITGTNQATISIEKDSTRVWRTTLRVNNPRLWTPKNPNLYIMKVTLRENGQVIDEYYTQFGIRTITTSVDKVYLNNNPIFFVGVARHEDHPIYGRSVPLDVIYSDLLKVKEVNALMLRTAHYPNHPYTYLLTDRLGIAVVEEIPVWWFDDTMAWVIQNNIRHIHEQMFREMAFRDYNRPSIILWSLTNENLDVDNRKTFMNRVKQEIKSLYPDGRLITQSAAADRPGPNDPSQQVVDVAGWTMYFGIFHGGTYYEGTRLFLTMANYYYPEKPILDTEFGYWSGENNAIGGQNAQVTVFKETFSAFTFRASVIRPDGSYRDGGYLMGVTWWCIFDWYTHTLPDGFQSMGLYRMFRDTAKFVRDTLKKYYEPFFNIGGMVTDVEEEILNHLPHEYNLFQNYPNPFNPTTRIRYSVKNTQLVQIRLFDLLGREIKSLVNEIKSPGNYEIELDANLLGLSTGVYVYQMKAGEFIGTRKLIYLK